MCGNWVDRSIDLGILASVVILAAVASGQDIQYRGGTPPQEFLTDADGFPIQYWVAWEGYRPRSRWSERSPPVEPALPFVENEPYYALDYHLGEHGPYYLLARFQAGRPGPPIGWVRADICFRNEADMNPDTKVYMKAMIVNRVEDFSDGDVQLDASLQPSLAPAEDGQLTEHGDRLFNIFFQYARTTPAAYGFDEEEYVLIGNAQGFTSGTVRNVVQGWIPARRIVSWETREGWKWDHASTRRDAVPRRTRPGVLYPSPAAALRDLQSLEGTDEHALHEVFDEFGESPRLQPHHMRMPALSYRPDAQIVAQSGGNELVKVLFVGGFRGASQPIRGSQFDGEVGSEFEAASLVHPDDTDRVVETAGAPWVQEAFVWRFSPGLEEAGVPQVRSQLLLAETELQKVIDLMKHLTSQRGDLFGRRITVEEALTRLLATFLGEEPDPERSVADYLTMRTGLKVHSPLLNRPLQARFPERLALQEFEKIVHRVQLLEDIRNGVTRDWGQEQHQVQGAEITRWIAGPAIRAEEDRFFTLPGDTIRWYWIDVETEMP